MKGLCAAKDRGDNAGVWMPEPLIESEVTVEAQPEGETKPDVQALLEL
jgi:hypothetical protein